MVAGRAISELFFRIILSNTILMVEGVSPWWGVTSTMCPMILQPFVARPGGTDLRSSVVLAMTGSPTWAFLESTGFSRATRIKVPGVNCIAIGGAVADVGADVGACG